MDINAVVARREKLSEKLNRNTKLWKPQSGTTNIRILPYKENEADPFVMLYWHWNIGKTSALCLYRNFGEDNCPICQFATHLYHSDDEADQAIAKKLFPKIRFYVPITVRGQEADGPKWWGFSQKIYDTLVGTLKDKGCGDFTDVDSGRDIIVTYKTKKETGTPYGSLTAKVSMQISQLHDDPEIVKALLEDQVDLVNDIYGGKKTPEDLTNLLEKWNNPEDAESSEQSSSSDTAKNDNVATDDNNNTSTNEDEDILKQLDDVIGDDEDK